MTRATFLAFLLIGATAFDVMAQSPAVVVTVSRQSRADGSVVYRYAVANRSRFPISAIEVGYGEKDWEFDQTPLGWRLGAAVPASSGMAPPGWKTEVMLQEESDKTGIEWSGGLKTFIEPGRTLGGFAVVTAKASAEHQTCHWRVFFATGSAPATGSVVQAIAK